MENNLPKHIAIILDGNGRWASRKMLPRFRGHLEGVKRVEEISEIARRMGIKVLTLFVFSTENWRRPSQEVSMLMATLDSVLQRKTEKLMKTGIRLHFIGRRDGIPIEVMQSLEKAMELTKHNTGMTLNLALNYGSRLEILDATKLLATAVKRGDLDIDQINEQKFSDVLYTKGLPDPDLLVRTSGEKRISNFLLWQLSYAEFYFTDVCWPDFNETEFLKAITEYQQRDRRYGQVSPSSSDER